MHEEKGGVRLKGVGGLAKKRGVADDKKHMREGECGFGVFCFISF